jgi:hypothetical protein
MMSIVIKRKRILFWVVTLAALLFGAVPLASTEIGEASSDLIINEFVAANGAGLVDEDGDHSDWIEIYNRSDQPVNLSGWSLTDDAGQPEKWTFPNITLNGHHYLVVFASGKDRKPVEANAHLHTNFRLKRSGEFFGLYSIFEQRFMDEISPPFAGQLRDVAYGRYGAGPVFGYFPTPTPGGPNDPTPHWIDVVAPVEFSVQRGIYDEPILLELQTATPGAAIRYTLDGSEPTETKGLTFVHPLHIDRTTLVRAMAFKPGYRPAEVTTHTFIFLADVLHQPAQPPGFPTTWGTHLIDFAGYRAGSPVMPDYEMDPDIVDDPRYRQLLLDGLTSIPTLSLVTDMANLDIYSKPHDRGLAWERPVSVELIDPGGEQPGFQLNAGLRIQGGVGRWAYMPKHSFRLFFQGSYGPTKLEYPLFPDSPVERFDTLTLRGGVNKSFAGRPRGEGTTDHKQAVYARDEWTRASQIAMSGVGSHGLFVHLYLNGLYWGLYNVVERPDASFTSAYFGGQKEDWLAIVQGVTVTDAGELPGETISGARDRFDALQQLVANGDLAEPEKYAAVKSYLDVTEFVDYMILNWYAGNQDWADNNWYAGVQNPSGQLKYFVWDAENTWDRQAWVDLGDTGILGRPNLIKPLFEALIQNPDFRMELADRMYAHLFNDGALTEANATARWLELTNHLDPAIVAESARWGDVRYDNPITREDWLAARDKVLERMAGNVARLIQEAREAGYYPKLDPPEFSTVEEATGGIRLTLTAPTGAIYYTTDGADPRQPVTGLLAPNARPYSGPLVLSATTDLKARTRNDRSPIPEQNWSALHEATFWLTEPDPRLRITEIMYNPIGGGDYEFIELKNTGADVVDLSGLSFSGIRFDFPPNTPPLAPGEALVLARNAAAFAERYPGVSIAGIFQGQLSNQGETISLLDSEGQLIVSVSYDDENGWPVSPDGRGDSLVLVNLTGDPNDARSWRASTVLFGSPSRDEPAR